MKHVSGKMGISNRVYVFMLISMVLIVLCGCSKKNNESEIEVLKTEFETNEGIVELEKVSALSDQIEILIPQNFDIMEEEMAKFKYPMEDRPSLIYTNDNASINICFKHTTTQVENEEIGDYNEIFKRIYAKMNLIEWYGDGIIQLNDKNTGYNEMLTSAIDTDIYNLIYFTELDGRLLLVSLNCTKEQMEDWKPIAKAILNSLTIKQ